MQLRASKILRTFSLEWSESHPRLAVEQSGERFLIDSLALDLREIMGLMTYASYPFLPPP